MNKSEKKISKISSNIFFKEFTFDKNNFFSENGEDELADLVLYLGDLLFIIQVKERNRNEIKSEKDENKWFDSKVLKKAKTQIKNSIEYLNSYKEINIKNKREHQIDITKANQKGINKVIIYDHPQLSLISEDRKSMKFYESKISGNIHIFEIESYKFITELLHTPSEFDEFLKFRERFYLKHKNVINELPELYIIKHFIVTPDETEILEECLAKELQLKNNTDEYDLKNYLNNFSELIYYQNNPTDYYYILREIASLNRSDLIEFKKRLRCIYQNIKAKKNSLPYRFAIPRTSCGFVFLPIVLEKGIENWKIILNNQIIFFKYKHKLKKCVGVCMFIKEGFFEIGWSFCESDWVFDEELESIIKIEKTQGIYGNGNVEKIDRYRFKFK